MSNGKLVLSMVAVLLIGAVMVCWTSRGYGKVSPGAYEFSKAIIGACQAKSDDRVKAVEGLLAEDSDVVVKISNTERGWLESMISKAKDGDWKSAANSARRMMEDQVEY